MTEFQLKISSSRLTKGIWGLHNLSDYADFSFGEDRLSDDERLSEPVDVFEFGFVAEYEVCGDTENFFNNIIYELNYRYHTSKAQALANEILDINALF